MDKVGSDQVCQALSRSFRECQSAASYVYGSWWKTIYLISKHALRRVYVWVGGACCVCAFLCYFYIWVNSYDLFVMQSNPVVW